MSWHDTKVSILNQGLCLSNSGDGITVLLVKKSYMSIVETEVEPDLFHHFSQFSFQHLANGAGGELVHQFDSLGNLVRCHLFL